MSGHTARPLVYHIAATEHPDEREPGWLQNAAIGWQQLGVAFTYSAAQGGHESMIRAPLVNGLVDQLPDREAG